MSIHTQPPEIREISSISFPKITQVPLDNGISVCIEHSDSIEVVKFQLVFRAGRPYESKKLATRFCAEMLKEGTSKLTGIQFAEKFESLGASFRVGFDMDRVYLSVYCLSKYLADLLKLLTELLDDAAFPESPLERIKQKAIQRLNYNLSKPDTVSYRLVTESIFGPNHPYGYNSVETDISGLERGDLIDHFDSTIKNRIEHIFVSGCISDDLFQEINRIFGQHKQKNFKKLNRMTFESSLEPKAEHIGVSAQTSIKLGRLGVTRDHEDYFPLYVTNVILGGYFGSRLMSRIREEKGLTYNIYSMLEMHEHAGSLIIGSEVNSSAKDEALEAIFIEMELLQNELVSKEELSTVKNYMIGTLLHLVDGPFNRMKAINNVLCNNLAHNYYDQLFDVIKTIESEKICSIAAKYLSKTDFMLVETGNLS